MSPRRVFASISRGPGLARRLVRGTGFVILAWAIGLIVFAFGLPRVIAEPELKTGAIVVLTGGSGRVHQGLELLASAHARKLFVSGVYRGVDVKELLRVSQQSPQDLECCIALGYQADNTRGNAVETKAWMQTEKLSSLRLVTSSYHMPRSLLEFHRAMPDMKIVPHPVFPSDFQAEFWWTWPAGVGLIASEYNKYLAALVWNFLAGEPTP